MHGRIVVIQKDGSEGAGFDVMTEKVTFGRDKDCDIRLKIPLVSRKHADLHVDENGQCVINNVSSTNNTYVNKKAISCETILNDRDVISIGDREFVFISGNNIPFLTSLWSLTLSTFFSSRKMCSCCNEHKGENYYSPSPSPGVNRRGYDTQLWTKLFQYSTS